MKKSPSKGAAASRAENLPSGEGIQVHTYHECNLGNRTNMHGHVAVVHEHVWYTCMQCFCDERAFRPARSMQLVIFVLEVAPAPSPVVSTCCPPDWHGLVWIGCSIETVLPVMHTGTWRWWKEIISLILDYMCTQVHNVVCTWSFTYILYMTCTLDALSLNLF